MSNPQVGWGRDGSDESDWFTGDLCRLCSAQILRTSSSHGVFTGLQKSCSLKLFMSGFLGLLTNRNVPLGVFI